jgi:AcrR family transcriptional regulator
MKTEEKLVAAAAALLDGGGEEAVTLRAVAQAVGVSHNAPYKHFKSRDALLAAVAAADLGRLAATLREIRQSHAKPLKKLTLALRDMMEYGSKHPARYQLLLNDPRFATLEGDLKEAAEAHFEELDSIVRECQSAGKLPGVSHITLSGLLFATVHGLVCLEASGRWTPDKGLTGTNRSLDLMMRLLATIAD